MSKSGGRGGIRTHGRFDPTLDFESSAFNHSATLPIVDFPAAREFRLDTISIVVVKSPDAIRCEIGGILFGAETCLLTEP